MVISSYGITMRNSRFVERSRVKISGIHHHRFKIQVTEDALNFKNKLSPYVGLTLLGQVEQTYLRGILVYDRKNLDGKWFGDLAPTGQLL